MKKCLILINCYPFTFPIVGCSSPHRPDPTGLASLFYLRYLPRKLAEKKIILEIIISYWRYSTQYYTLTCVLLTKLLGNLGQNITANSSFDMSNPLSPLFLIHIDYSMRFVPYKLQIFTVSQGIINIISFKRGK